MQRRALDLTISTRDALAPCAAPVPGQTRPARRHRRPRLAWERTCEAEAGFFGRALLEGDAVIGWMHVAPSYLVPRARCLPAGPPSSDAYLLACSYFYDEEYHHGFQFLLQEIEASLKHRRAAAIEAFALRRPRPGGPFTAYIRELNLFHPEVLEGGGFRMMQVKGDVARYRLDLATLVEAPRRSRAWKKVKPASGTAAQPV